MCRLRTLFSAISMNSAATVVTMKKMTLAKASQNQVSALASEDVEILGRPSDTPSLAGDTVAIALLGSGLGAVNRASIELEPAPLAPSSRGCSRVADVAPAMLL